MSEQEQIAELEDRLDRAERELAALSDHMRSLVSILMKENRLETLLRTCETCRESHTLRDPQLKN